VKKFHVCLKGNPLRIGNLPIGRIIEWAVNNGADHVLDPMEGDAALEVHRLTGAGG
jgi:hypothetical protein